MPRGQVNEICAVFSFSLFLFYLGIIWVGATLFSASGITSARGSIHSSKINLRKKIAGTPRAAGSRLYWLRGFDCPPDSNASTSPTRKSDPVTKTGGESTLNLGIIVASVVGEDEKTAAMASGRLRKV
jgi:hypothetical protein